MARRIVDKRKEGAVGSPTLEPVVGTPINLHQFAATGPSRPSGMEAGLATLTGSPQPGRRHPLP